MTPLQKTVVEKLLSGCSIAGNPAYGYRLRDSEARPFLKFNHRSFSGIKDLLRKSKGTFVINKSKVRQLHGRSWAKQHYKLLNQQHETEVLQ